MPRPRSRLTRELIQQISAHIAAGAFDHVACESLGVPEKVFQRWLRKGEKSRSRGLYLELVNAVRKARAEARLEPEKYLREHDPKTWLLSGPGRQSSTQPGWGTWSRNEADNHREIMSPKLEKLISIVLKALRRHPKTHDQLVEFLNRKHACQFRKLSAKRPTSEKRQAGAIG